MSADSTSIDKTCRLCKDSLLTEKNHIHHSKVLFCAKEPRPLSERFRNIGVTVPCKPGVYSGRICLKCFRQLENVEKWQAIVKKWQSDLLNESDSHVKEEADDGGSMREKRERSPPPPTETPPKKKLLQRVNPGSRVSLTEVYITYPSKPKPERYRCDAGISGVINHLAKRNFTTAARLMVQHDDLMADLKPVIEAVIDEECQHLCRRREGFMLWKSSPEELKNFSLDNLRKDLERMAPFMFSLFCTISGMKTNHACAAAAIALRGRESHLSAFAYYVNTVLKYGGAKKAAFECLSKLGITTTHGNCVLKQHALSELCGAQVHKLNAHIENGCTLEESIGEPSTPHASIEIEVDISESEESDLGLD